MEKELVELYSDKELERIKNRLTVWRIIAVVFALITLGVCIYLCTKVDKHEPLPSLIKVCACSVLGGWAVITLRVFVIKRLRLAKAHCEAILKGPREEVTGSFSFTGERVFIANGVSMKSVKCEAEGGETLLQIYDKKAKRFPAQSAARVCTVYGFIAAYGE